MNALIKLLYLIMIFVLGVAHLYFQAFLLIIAAFLVWSMLDLVSR